jgi:lipopolysaccharide exporter
MQGDRLLTPVQSPKMSLIKGAFWAVGTRWSIKAIGFLNTVIMARLLMPSDYGVVAMAMLMVGLIQSFMDLGVTTALVRKGDLERAEIDSAWTLRVIQSFAIALTLVVGSYWASVFFEEPRVQMILWVLALCIVFEGAGNIGLVLAYKAFNFSLEFRVNVISKSLSVLATLTVGYWLRDYRALVVGITVGYLSTFLLSYAMHSYRPSWNTSKMGEIWSVTKWLMLGSMGTFLLRRTDELIAARAGTTTEYGTYHVGADLGRLPVGELGPSLMRAFLPVLSSIKSDVERTSQAVLKALSAANTLTLPVGFGVAAVATPLTLLILGEKWEAAVPFVAGFALVASAQFSISPLNSLLILNGHTKTQSSVIWVELVAFVAAALLLMPQFHLIGLVYARLLAMVVSAFVTIRYAQRLCGVRGSLVLRVLWRPLLGSVGMYVLVSYVIAGIPTGLAQLVAGTGVGVFVYSSWLALSWWLVGKPEGLESTLVDTGRLLLRKSDR